MVKILYENWIYFPYEKWVDHEARKIRIPPLENDDDPKWIDATSWTYDVRIEGEKALKAVLRLENYVYSHIDKLLIIENMV